jgi:hypothetical protein
MTLSHDVTVTANVIGPAVDGWQSGGRQVPTFTLPANVHGLVSLHHAGRIAADILSTAAPAGTVLHLSLVHRDDALSVSYRVDARAPIGRPRLVTI